MFNIDKLTVKEQLLFTTVRIATFKENKVITGTSFIFVNRTETEIHHFLVTNRHVVEKSEKGIIILRGRKGLITDPKNSITFNISHFASYWYFHPKPDIDLAIMPFGIITKELEKNKKEAFHLPLENIMIPSEEKLRKEIDAIEEVIFIGYPNNLYDRENYLPIVRKGITATPIYVDFNNLPIFLIDASVFHGSSGSPVFIADFRGYITRSGNHFLNKRRIYFLGILSKGFQITKSDVIRFEDNSILNAGNKEPMVNIGAVIKAKEIISMINSFRKTIAIE
ncbi:MAG: S1 family peptidase [Candidatus Heimdallarchaeaceae archaeon]